jgi:hypothetical protein
MATQESLSVIVLRLFSNREMQSFESFHFLHREVH